VASRLPHQAAKRLVREVLKAWRITKGQGVTVAVIGGRVDPQAPGLAGKVRNGRGFGDLARSSQFDGTPFASAVAGSGPSQRNPYGTIGLAPAARILSIRVPAKVPNQQWFDISADAIRYAARRGAKVIYFNSADYGDEATLDMAVRYAVSRGAVIVCGDFGFGKRPNHAEFPASLPGVITAGTMLLPGLVTPPRKNKPSLNDSVLVSGPGNVLYVTGAQGAGYFIYNSYAAAAWVTATVALVKSLYPHLSPALTEQALTLSATARPRGGYSIRAGYGLVNPLGALHEAAKLRKLRKVARNGAGTVNPAGRLAAGPAPGAIDAVRHPLAKLAGFGAAAAIGVVLLGLAAVRIRRSRRRLAPATPGDGLARAVPQPPPPVEALPYGRPQNAPPFGFPQVSSPSMPPPGISPFGPRETPSPSRPADSSWFGPLPESPPGGPSSDSPPARQPPTVPPYRG
jgi:hypothetical protein